MGSTAKFSISASVAGLPETGTGETQGFVSTFSSTNAHYSIASIVATTGSTGHGSAPGVVVPSSATVVYVVPTQSTNPSTAGIRVTQSTAVVGVYLGYRKPSLLNVESTVETTFHFYTTGNTTVPLRVVVI